MRLALASLLAAAVGGVMPASAQAPQALPGITVTAPRPKPAPVASPSPGPPAAVDLSITSGPQPTDTSDFGAVQSLDPRAADVGVAQSSSQGVVQPAQLLAQPVYRTGELLEAMPGLIVTQHSGEGKANQYFPARLQPRPRHGPRHHHRRYAGQHAHPRSWPGLCRYQLHDPRDHARACLSQRALTSLPTVILPRPVQSTSTSRTSWKRTSPKSKSAVSGIAAPWPACRLPSAWLAPCWLQARSSTSMDPGIAPTTCAGSTASCAIPTAATTTALP